MYTTTVELDARPMLATLVRDNDMKLRGVLNDVPMAHFRIEALLDETTFTGMWFSEPLPCCEEHDHRVVRYHCTVQLSPDRMSPDADVTVSQTVEEEYPAW